MVSLILFGSFFVLLLLNVPIGLSLGISSVAALIAENLPFSMIPSNLYSSTGKSLYCWPFPSLSWAATSWKRAGSPPG